MLLPGLRYKLHNNSNLMLSLLQVRSFRATTLNQEATMLVIMVVEVNNIYIFSNL